MDARLVVVGGGPAGMAAALNAGAEGIETVLVEGVPHVGGRAETSHAIENYLGHVSISGRDLAAIGHAQLDKFGVRVIHGEALRLGQDDDNHNLIQLSRGRTLSSEFLVLACGMRPVHSTIPGADKVGVLSHAEPLEIPKWAGKRVVIVGGENSAAQAALAYADGGAAVTILSPAGELTGMSSYLRPLVGHSLIQVMAGLPTRIGGEECCKYVDTDTGLTLPADVVVMFEGARPNTEWLGGKLDLDGRNFILTDRQFLTSRSRVYAVGDVRSGSVKRIGAAVGEGTSVVHWIRRAF